MITVMETVRSLWNAGLQRADAERISKNLSNDEYFQRLEAVVLSIKDHLRRHELLKPWEATVKHGDGTRTVTVDLPNMRVRPDPEDPARAIFDIPAKEGT
jgi:hypothetical protein